MADRGRYGLEPILTDAKVANFARTWLEPALAVEDYYVGLYDVTLAIGKEIVDQYEPGAQGSNPDVWVWDWRGIVLGIVVFIMVGVLTGGRIFLWIGSVLKRGGFGGGRSGGGGARGRV